LPEFVITEMIDIMVRFTVKQQSDIWKVMQQSLKRAETLLQYSAVTVIFKLDNKVEIREIGLHDPPSRVFGISSFFCGGLNCHTQAMELRYSSKPHADLMKEKIRQTCRRCSTQSGWVKFGDVDWIHPLPGSKRIVWHHYPVTKAQMSLFARA
jgi:hypothetical protein